MDIKVTPSEAVLIDYLITMHSYDSSLLELLKTDMAKSLRRKAAKIIVKDEGSQVSFTPDEAEYLLIVVPITFRFLEDDIGFSLKKKMLATLVPKEIKLNWKSISETRIDEYVKTEDNNNDPSGDPDKNYPEDKTQNCS